MLIDKQGQGIISGLLWFTLREMAGNLHASERQRIHNALGIESQFTRDPILITDLKRPQGD